MFNPFLKTNNSSIPEWAGTLSEQRYLAFRKKLLRATNGAVDATKANRDGSLPAQDMELNLSNLALVVSKLNGTEGDDEIQRWARAFLSAKDTSIPPYPKGIQGLQLQFYPVGYFGVQEDDRYLTRIDLPGVLTTVVIDMPDRLIAAPRRTMGGWADHEEDTFTRLISKMADRSPYPVDYLPLRYNNETVAIIASDSTTAATHALVLGKLYTELIGTYATLVGVPTGTTILVKPLGSKPSPELVSSFQEVVNFMAKGQPGYLSNEVYLYKNSAYTRAEA